MRECPHTCKPIQILANFTVRMLQFKETQILNIIAHGVENKTNDGRIFLSLEEMELEERAVKLLTQHFTKPFQNREDFHHFHHDIDLKMNEVFVTAKQILDDENFILNSANIAKHLYTTTRHHAVKDGELFEVYFDGIELGNQVVSAVGIYKSEKKQNFFRIKNQRGSISLDLDKGIAQYKIDKACLILNAGREEGFRVMTYEHNGLDAEYWKSDFLSVRPTNDSFSQTTQLISICKDFIQNEMDVSRFDQINLINKSVEVLTESELLNVEEFSKTVFEDSSMHKQFVSFRSNYTDDNLEELPAEIPVSLSAVKKQSKKFKSVLKLDKNFHIYIHGDRNLIEHGVDENGKKFYKLYYQEEE